MVKKEQQEDKVDIQLTVEDIYKELCPACKEKLEKRIEEKIASQYTKKLAKQILEGDKQ